MSTSTPLSRAEILHQNFQRRVQAGDFPARAVSLTPADVGLTTEALLELAASQFLSRHLDIVARRLRGRNEGFYTIGSSGHEGNAVLGRVFRHTDMAFLHYRDAAFLIQRSKQLPDQNMARDILLSMVASSEDPVSGGRHKVLGSAPLFVPPQTSTIASHLPKAMGAAFSIGLADRLKLPDTVMPRDAVILCTFGDASANHSTALGAINTAAWAAFQGAPMPIVFVCEDNGIGISVRTPKDWIRSNFSQRPGLHYLYCDGIDLCDTQRAAEEAAHIARSQRRPVFLHMRTVRLLGHAGDDLESEYRSAAEIEADEVNDPLLHTARLLVTSGACTADKVLEMYLSIERQVAEIAEEVIKLPKLTSAAEVMEPLLPPHLRESPPVPSPTVIAESNVATREQRTKFQPLARHINFALADLLLQYPGLVLCGQDIGAKGGVYGVTQGLQKRFGATRVIDTLLDEQSIFGLGIGLAHNNMLAIPEIQFLAYVHNAEDQIRGEAATLPFFSRGKFSNPMVIRLPGLAYQKGFGGHFHNDNSLTVFRDIPGLIMACPSNGRDAAAMLRTCVAEAWQNGRVICFIEPIALYHTRDLHQSGDGLYASVYESPTSNYAVPLGQPVVHGDGTDLCILTYGNGMYLSRQAEKVLRETYEMNLRIVDIRWLAPLPSNAIAEAVADCRNILIVDECRRSGSVSEALVTLLYEAGVYVPIERINAEDSFVPLGAAAELVLPSRDRIIEQARKLVSR